MKFGCCMSMLPNSPSKTGYEFISLAGELGFDYVELPVAQVMAMSDEAFTSGPLPAVKSAGIPCLRMNNFLPGTLRLTGPEARHPEALAYAEKALSRAERLGVDVVVLGSSGARNRPLHWSLAQAESQMSDFLGALAPIAEAHGIAIAIEHLNKLESNIINSYASAPPGRTEHRHRRCSISSIWICGRGSEPVAHRLPAQARPHHPHAGLRFLRKRMRPTTAIKDCGNRARRHHQHRAT